MDGHLFGQSDGTPHAATSERVRRGDSGQGAGLLTGLDGSDSGQFFEVLLAGLEVLHEAHGARAAEP